MPYEERARPHTLTLEERERMSVSGVEELVRFDEELIVVRTVRGELSIHGHALVVDELDKTGGELRLSGEVDELIYAKGREERGRLWARLWG